MVPGTRYRYLISSWIFVVLPVCGNFNVTVLNENLEMEKHNLWKEGMTSDPTKIMPISTTSDDEKAAISAEMLKLMQRVDDLERSSRKPAAAEKFPSAQQKDRPFDLDIATSQEIQLPFESLYGLACIGPAQAEREDYRCCGSDGDSIKAFFRFWIMIVQNYLLLAINYVCQVLFIQLLIKNAKENAGKDETCGSAYFMRLVCICLFLGTVYSDIVESFDMIEWHFTVKTESELKVLEVANIDDDDKAELVSGLTCLHKLFNFVFIIGPKLAIAIAVFIYGGTFIALSPNDEEAFLNTLAGYFILEIDEILYKGFASTIMTTAVSKIPPIKKTVSEPMALCSLLCCNIFLMILIFFSYVIINREVCITPFELFIPSSGELTCGMNNSHSSWISTLNNTECASMDMSICQQNFIAMLVPEPRDYALVTGCGEHCNTTLTTLEDAGYMSTLSMAAMILQIFGLCAVTLMILAAVGDSEFVALGVCTMSCFTVTNVVLHLLAISTAASVSQTFSEVRAANCFDVTVDQGVELDMIIQDIVSGSNLMFSVSIALLVFSILEFLLGFSMMCIEKAKDVSGCAILCCQLIVSVLTWVAYGGSQVIMMSAEKMIFHGANATTEGWCTGMTAATANCVSNIRGQAYETPATTLTFWNHE